VLEIRWNRRFPLDDVGELEGDRPVDFRSAGHHAAERKSVSVMSASYEIPKSGHLLRCWGARAEPKHREYLYLDFGRWSLTQDLPHHSDCFVVSSSCPQRRGGVGENTRIFRCGAACRGEMPKRDARAVAAPDAAVHDGSRLPLAAVGPNTSYSSQEQQSTSGRLRSWPLARRLRGVRDQEVVASHLGWLTAKQLANRSAVARPQDDAHVGSPSADGRFLWSRPQAITSARTAAFDAT
jgi:hypothetical protein